MNEGYIYCFSNSSMPGILKIGITERTPDIRLKEANVSDTWKPPTPYVIEFAKKIYNPKEKETTIHILLTQYTERINSRREFFRVSLEEVKIFFKLMDGELWDNEHTVKKKNDDNDGDKDEEGEYDEEDEEKTLQDSKTLHIKGCRNMSECFTNGQKIRHTIGINKTWIGLYDSLKKAIIYRGNVYRGNSPLNKFATSHYELERSSRVSVNAWRECECEVDGKWVSTFSLPQLNK